MSGDKQALYRIRRYMCLHRQRLIAQYRYSAFTSGHKSFGFIEPPMNELLGYLAYIVSAEIEDGARSTNRFIEKEKECIARYQRLLSEAKERKKQAKTKKQ